MKALVIGGNRGFGKAMCDELAARGYQVITVNRTSRAKERLTRPDQHFSCDIAESLDWECTLRAIKRAHPMIDLLACIVGYAKACRFTDLNDEDIIEGLWLNAGYVTLAMSMLLEQLTASDNPRVITIGSRWSLRTDCPELTPYFMGKHALAAFVHGLGNDQPGIMSACYCVPAMDTPGFHHVRRSFVDIGLGSWFDSRISLSEQPVETIAKAIAIKALSLDEPGHLYEVGATTFSCTCKLIK